MSRMTYNELMRRISPYMNRGGVIELPPGIEQYYSEEAAALIIEHRRLTDDFIATNAERRAARDSLPHVKAEYEAMLVVAVKAGDPQPDDPVPELETSIERLGATHDAFVKALTLSARELFKTLLDEQDEAFAGASADAAKLQAGIPKAVDNLAMLLEKSRETVKMMEWVERPSTTFLVQPLPSEKLVADLALMVNDELVDTAS